MNCKSQLFGNPITIWDPLYLLWTPRTFWELRTYLEPPWTIWDPLGLIWERWDLFVTPWTTWEPHVLSGTPIFYLGPPGLI